MYETGGQASLFSSCAEAIEVVRAGEDVACSTTFTAVVLRMFTPYVLSIDIAADAIHHDEQVMSVGECRVFYCSVR